ncbi:MAG: anthranilate synthase component I family protein [Solirubrobacterales bacterium]
MSGLELSKASTFSGAGFCLSSPDPVVLPSFTAFLADAAAYDYAVVYSAARIDHFDVTLFYERLRPEGPSALLESLAGDRNARYSIIGLNPLFVTRATGPSEPDPVRAFIAGVTAPNLNLPHFTGGLIGFWSYEFGLDLLAVPRRPEKRSELPDMAFFLPGTVAVYDRHEKVLKIFMYIESTRADQATYDQAAADIMALLDLGRGCQDGMVSRPVPRRDREVSEIEFTAHTDAPTFYRQVETALDHITRGDIFQVQISRRWSRKSTVSPWSVYLALRQLNPSPYLFFVQLEDMILLGASPEIQITVEDDRIISRPIAGTRKLSGHAVRDEARRRELLIDEKERAEHLMLVDLARNDVGRVAETGTVKVTDLMRLENYSHVVHLVSTVEGRMRPGRNAADAFDSNFPAGTLTGAPKKKAMEIIESLESLPRELYGGAVGHVSFGGDIDSAIVIRSMVWRSGTFSLQAAGGIVADSNPADEYKETLNKARATMLAVLEAEEWEHDTHDR